MAELVGLVIGIAAFALQIGGRIKTIQDLREFTPAEVAGQLQRLSDRLELFRTHVLALQPVESHPAVKPAIQQASWRLCVVDDIVQKVQRKLVPESNARPGRRAGVKLILSRQRVEEQIKKAEDNINGMSHDFQRQVLLMASSQSMI